MKRNYDGLTAYDYISLGWSDGYADLRSDCNEIITQLFDKKSKEELTSIVDYYLQGYELGHFMSEEAEFIYDKDGNLKDDYDFSTVSNREHADYLVRTFKRK